MAADLAARPYTKAPPAPIATVYNWTGFYGGLNGGYGWGSSTGNLVGNSGGIAIPAAIAGGTIPTALGVRPEGWLGGAQIGYNWQYNQVVFGLEADIQGAGIKQSVGISRAAVVGLLPTFSTGSSELDWFGTVRGRIGYAWNTVLLYATGGLAYGGVSDSASSATVPPPPAGFGSNGATRVGWTAGAGVEWAFTPNWTLKGEYLHVDLGSSNTTVVFPADFLVYRFQHQYDMVRIGVNYKFTTGGAVVAKY
ncbi:outer membrane protein [Bradyrhizobium sp.]|uniref:outer membrane protein n=1 Tax=Bradyrhizobium sp. TaxID=376 RepID=UPI0039E25C74